MSALRSRKGGRGQALTEVALILPLAILLVLGGYDTSVMGSDKVIATGAVRNGVRLGSELGGAGSLSGGPGTCSGAGSLTMAQADAQVIATVLAATTNMTYLGGGTPHAGFPDEIDIYRPKLPPSTSGILDKLTLPYESYTPETSTLASALSNGNTYNTLTVSALTAPIPNGTSVTLTRGSSTQTVVTRAAAAQGATTIQVNSFVANASYDNTTAVGATTVNFTQNHNAGSNYTMDLRCQGPLGSESEIGVRMAWTYKPANGIPGPKFVFDDGPGLGHLPADWAVEKLALCIENCILK